MSKNIVTRPNRDPDHYSKRGVPYYWAPEWIRGTSADDRDHERIKANLNAGWTERRIVDDSGSFLIPASSYGKIHAVKENGDVNLYMKSKTGNLTYIQGSIQQEFKGWHEDRSIDYILLGMDADEILNEQD